jgi:hypothetical protein
MPSIALRRLYGRLYHADIDFQGSSYTMGDVFLRVLWTHWMQIDCELRSLNGYTQGRILLRPICMCTRSSHV